MDLETKDVPAETVAHIQSAGCKAQKQGVIGEHNRCWKYLVSGVCVDYCSTYYKAVREGRGGKWRTCATRDYEPRPV